MILHHYLFEKDDSVICAQTDTWAKLCRLWCFILVPVKQNLFRPVSNSLRSQITPMINSQGVKIVKKKCINFKVFFFFFFNLFGDQYYLMHFVWHYRFESKSFVTPSDLKWETKTLLLYQNWVITLQHFYLHPQLGHEPVVSVLIYSFIQRNGPMKQTYVLLLAIVKFKNYP